MTTAWRIVQARYAATAFSGAGARLAGGRWNSVGVPVVYLSSTLSLAMLEILVHLQSEELLRRYVAFDVAFDEADVAEIEKPLPRNWKRSPPLVATQFIGDRWFGEGKSPVLRVPSAVVDAESNFLLNPMHRRFNRVRIGKDRDVKFDRRLK